jgi:hypothetical protein
VRQFTERFDRVKLDDVCVAVQVSLSLHACTPYGIHWFEVADATVPSCHGCQHILSSSMQSSSTSAATQTCLMLHASGHQSKRSSMYAGYVMRWACQLSACMSAMDVCLHGQRQPVALVWGLCCQCNGLWVQESSESIKAALGISSNQPNTGHDSGF